MRKVEPAPIPPSMPQGRMTFTAGNIPVIIVALFAIAVAIDLVRRNAELPRYGEAGELAVVQPLDQDEYVTVRVTPYLVDGQLKTPTWEGLFKTYNLRDSDLTAALEAYNRQIGEEDEYALPSTSIPAGTSILLPVR